jgi:hypothetical protein
MHRLVKSANGRSDLNVSKLDGISDSNLIDLLMINPVFKGSRYLKVEAAQRLKASCNCDLARVSGSGVGLLETAGQ